MKRPRKMLNSILLINFLFLLSFANLTKSQLSDISEIKGKINRLQNEMDELVVKKNQALNKSELDKTLDKIVRLHQEIMETRKNYSYLLETVAKESPGVVETIREQDRVENELRKSKKERKNNISQEKIKEKVDPLTEQLDGLLAIVQAKYAFFTKQKNKYVDEAEKEIKLKEMRVKERERKDYLENQAKQKFVQ